MKTLILATVVALTACAAPQTGPPIKTVDGCVNSAIYDCKTGVWTSPSQVAQTDPCDLTVTNPYIFVQCPTRKAEADAAMLRIAQQEAASNAMAARQQADWLYCNMQAQIASANTRGILYPVAVYGQVRNTCLQMKAAERAASN